MTAVVIDGNAIAQEIRAEAAQAVAALQSRHGVSHRASRSCSWATIRPRRSTCATRSAPAARPASYAQTINLPGSASQDEVIAEVRQLNADPAVHGILVQLPLPSHVDERAVIMSLDPDKDVDGLTP